MPPAVRPNEDRRPLGIGLVLCGYFFFTVIDSCAKWLSLGGLPRSINHMTPGNSFVRALASIPVAPEIPTHSIIAVSGNKPLAEDDDGIVKYESAHLDDTQSELVIHSGHSVHGHPLAIAEVRRILYLHGENACRSEDLCGTAKEP